MIVMRRLSHALPHSDSYDCHVTLLEAHYCRYAAAVYTVPLMLMGSLTGPLLSPSASSSGPGGTTPLALSSGDLTLSRSFPLAFTRSEGERRILKEARERGGRERKENCSKVGLTIHTCRHKYTQAYMQYVYFTTYHTLTRVPRRSLISRGAAITRHRSTPACRIPLYHLVLQGQTSKQLPLTVCSMPYAVCQCAVWSMPVCRMQYAVCNMQYAMCTSASKIFFFFFFFCPVGHTHLVHLGGCGAREVIRTAEVGEVQGGESRGRGGALGGAGCTQHGELGTHQTRSIHQQLLDSE